MAAVYLAMQLPVVVSLSEYEWVFYGEELKLSAPPLCLEMIWNANLYKCFPKNVSIYRVNQTELKLRDTRKFDMVDCKAIYQVKHFTILIPFLLFAYKMHARKCIL